MEIPSGWQKTTEGPEALEREFIFESFLEAMAFVGQVAVLAEELNHHPDMDLRYNHVIVRAWTHDVGGISDKDFTLANRLNSL